MGRAGVRVPQVRLIKVPDMRETHHRKFPLPWMSLCCRCFTRTLGTHSLGERALDCISFNGFCSPIVLPLTIEMTQSCLRWYFCNGPCPWRIHHSTSSLIGPIGRHCRLTTFRKGIREGRSSNQVTRAGCARTSCAVAPATRVDRKSGEAPFALPL